MITRELLKRIITEQRRVFLKTGLIIEREILSAGDIEKIISLKEAIIITGVRRCGKSYLMRLIWKKIAAAKKVKAENFLYVNFEDEKLLDFTAKDFDALLESYLELFEADQREKIYLFFDEIQNIKNWERFINRLLENGGYKIFITGSNAALLSKEIGAALTGRNYSLNLYPLSFKEFAHYKIGRSFQAKELYDQKFRILVKKTIKNYLANGGFPEVVLQNFRPLLQEYLKNIIYRDIVLRYRIKSEINLREIALFVISNIGTIISLEKIARMTKIKNIATVKNYLSYLESSFLFYLTPKYSPSIKKQIYNPDKIYAVDLGLYNEAAFLTSPNDGRLLENFVFLELKRLYEKIYYFKEERECDFIVKERETILAIQVTKLLTPENEGREIGGLLEAMETLNLKMGRIISADQEEERKIKGKTIKIIPIWKWLFRA